MSRKRKSGVVDGFSVYKAAQRAVQDKKVEGSADPPEKNQKGQPKKIGSHIGRTALPTKHDITCYDCGFEFQLTGRTKSTFCSKCRTHLTVENHVIDKEWEGELKTAGVVHIKPGGVVQSGTIKAGNVIMEGSVTGGIIHAYRWLELRPGATYDPAKMSSRDLRIGEDMQLIVPDLERHHIEVAGMLKARISSTGLVRIQSTGFIEGEIRGPRLQVDEGGGLRASVSIGMEEPEQTVTGDWVERSA